MRRIALLMGGTLLAVTLGISGLGDSAGAVASARVSGALSAGGLIAVKQTPPVVDIIASPGPAYNPNAVTGKKVTKKNCANASKYSFAIANTTTVDQQVVYTVANGGANFGPAIPSGQALAVCVSARGNFGAVFTLASNANASLSVAIK